LNENERQIIESLECDYQRIMNETKFKHDIYAEQLLWIHKKNFYLSLKDLFFVQSQTVVENALIRDHCAFIFWPINVNGHSVIFPDADIKENIIIYTCI